jgi:hypothetical protein
MEAKVDRVMRTARVSAETAAVLTTAAKGSAEGMARQAIQSVEEWIRREVRNVPSKDLPAKLRMLQGPYFAHRDQTEDPELWTKTLERVLSAEERAVCEAERAAAKEWRLQSQVLVVTTEIERTAVLSAEKRERLMQRLGEVIEEYEQDLAGMFSPWWHCEGYYTTIPLALMAEEELNEIFDSGQLETLRTRGRGEMEQMAEQIRANRKSRTKS